MAIVGNMDIALQNILINTYNNELTLRNQAERALNEFLLTPNFLAAFMVVIDGYRGPDDMPTLHHDIRTAACIVVKNNLRQFWTDPLTAGKTHPLSDQERDFCKEKLLTIAIKESDNTLKGLLAESIRIICETDYPDKWPYLLPAIIQNLQNPNFLHMSNALLILRKVVKRFEFRHKEARQPLDEIINRTFPIIQPIITQLQDNNQIEAALILRQCCKIFWSYTQYALPLNTQSQVDVGLWFNIMGKLMIKRLPEASEGLEPYGQPVDDDDRRNWPWWKLKKWIGRIMTHFIQKYGNPRYSAEEYKQFAIFFRSHYAIEWLGPVLTVLHEYYSGRSKFISSDVHRNCITFISNCTEMSPSYKVIKPHLDFILFQVIYPSLCLKANEIENFSNDPQEFLAMHLNAEEDALDPRTASSHLLQTLARYRQKDVIPKLLPFIQSVLSEYNAAPPAARNHVNKDGILVLVAYMFKILSDSKHYASIVEPFILHHVLPEFQSPVPFLRYRACWVVEYFTNLKFSTPGVIEALTQGLLAGLRDPTVPVQAAAACSLRMMMESDETTEIIRPSLPTLISEYFRIMDEVESESVLSALQAVIEKFEQDIHPMAVEMVSRLATIFQKQSIQAQDDEDGCFAAMHSLDTILAIMEAVSEDHPEILEQMQPFVIPIVQKILIDSDMAYEFGENMIHMLCFFTYYCNHITEACWTQLRTLLMAVDEWAFDYIGDIMTPVINYITRDISLFLRFRFSEKESVVEALYRIIEKCFTNDSDDIERESKVAANMITCLIVQCKQIQPSFTTPGVIPTTLNPIELFIPSLKLIVPRFKAAKSKRLRVKLLETTLAMMYYDFSAFMVILDQDPNTRDYLLQKLFDHLPEMDDVFTESNVLSFPLPQLHLPAVISTNLQPMLSQILREIELVEEEEEKQRQRDENSEDDDNDEDIDDDDDDDDVDEDDDVDVNPTKKGSEKSNVNDVIPDGGFDEDDDCVNQEDVNYQEMFKKLEAARVRKELARASGEEPIDDEEDEDDDLVFTSPVENMDLVLYFLDAIQMGYAREPQVITALQQGLVQDDANRLQQYMASVERRKAEAAKPSEAK